MEQLSRRMSICALKCGMTRTITPLGISHDRIDVKRNDGPFRQLRIEVTDAPIEIREMVVTFGDGKKFRPKIQARFREGHGSHVIDLPGNRRSIDGIEFVYRSINRKQGKGKVLVYAR
jgi:hypothetical protein